MGKIMLLILPIVGLVGTNNLSTAIIILGIAVILIFVSNPSICLLYGSEAGGLHLWEFFSAWRATAWSGWLSGEILKNTTKAFRPSRDLRHRKRRYLWERSGEQSPEAGIRAGGPE